MTKLSLRGSLLLMLAMAAGFSAPRNAQAAACRAAVTRNSRLAPKVDLQPRDLAPKLSDRRPAVVSQDGPLEHVLPKATAEKDLAQVITQVKELAKAGKPGVVTFDIDDTLVQTRTATPGQAEPGALAYVKEVAAAGGQVVYLTARPIFFKGQTSKQLSGLGFPLGEGQTLMMNPDPKKWDAVAWKENAKPMIEKLGAPVAFFDNDLANVRMLRQQFSKSEVFRLATFDGHKDPGGTGDIRVIKDFN